MENDIYIPTPNKVQPYAAPQVYLKTKSGACLGIIKLLEAIVNIGFTVMAVLLSGSFAAVVGALLNYLNNLIQSSMPATIFSKIALFILNTANTISSLLFVLLCAAPLVLAVLEGIGVFRLFCRNGGEGMVRFVHTIREIIYFLWLLVAAVDIFHIMQKMFNMDAFSGTFLLFLALFFGIVIFFCFRFERDIVSMMKTIEQERSSGHLCPANKNGLARKTLLLIILSAPGVLVSAIALLIAPQYAAEVTSEIQRYAGNAGNALSLVIVLINFVKLICIRNCARNFNQAHGN